LNYGTNSIPQKYNQKAGFTTISGKIPFLRSSCYSSSVFFDKEFLFSQSKRSELEFGVTRVPRVKIKLISATSTPNSKLQTLVHLILL